MHWLTTGISVPRWLVAVGTVATFALLVGAIVLAFGIYATRPKK